jgi:hypothetical protein
MYDRASDLLIAFETHAVERIRELLDDGCDLLAPIQGKLPVEHLIEMYLRSPRFAECLRLLLAHGAVLPDPRLAPVLLNDPIALRAAVRADQTLLAHTVTLPCTFTPLDGASLLHVAAEYGHVEVARELLVLGAAVDARAACDASGLNGHTPLFHAVNSHANHAAPVMEVLLTAGARADLRLRGITWGRGFPWETVCFDVTPVSYAQCGLLPQMHRREGDIYTNITRLLKACGRPVPPLGNVPNRYLNER